MRHSSIPQFVLKYSVAQPSLSMLNDVPEQVYSRYVSYSPLCIRDTYRIRHLVYSFQPTIVIILLINFTSRHGNDLWLTHI